MKQKIEEFFSELFGYRTMLFPSGRNAIHALMIAKEIARSDRVYIPNFSSNCLYSIFGRLASVSTDYKEQRIVLVNHKWGTINHTSADSKTSIIIEDSCDSILIDRSSLFPNGGNFQIFSLPKIIGGISGGLIVFRNPNDNTIETLIRNQNRDPQNRKQFRLKSNYFRKNMLQSSEWEHFEYSSQNLVRPELFHIMKNLGRYSQNLELIEGRRELIRKEFTKHPIRTHYIGPVAIFRIENDKDYQDYLGKKLIRKYFFDMTLGNGESGNFTPVYIFPIHLGITDKDFSSGLTALLAENSKLGGTISFLD